MKKKIFCLCLLFCVISAGYAYYRFAMRDTVSIILPAYNVEKYIDDCLTSLTSQSYKNLEIIAVDDDSTDSTYEKLQDWARKDKRIKLFHNEKNQGAALTRERALKEVTGEYIMFVDSDDYISPSYIKAMVRAARKSGADAVFNNSVVVDNEFKGEKESLPWWFIFPEGEFFLPTECNHEQGVLWGKLFKTSFLKSIDISLPAPLRYHSDMYISAVILANSPSVSVISHPAYYYRIRAGSLQTERTMNMGKNINKLQAEEMFLDYLKKHNLAKSVFLDVLQFAYILPWAQNKEVYYTLVRKFFMDNKDYLLKEMPTNISEKKFVSIKNEFVTTVLANETWQSFLDNTTERQRNIWSEGDVNGLHCGFILAYNR